MRIAVVGSGISGLAATWLLNEHSDHEVHLFEADDRAGGHTDTKHCRLGGADVDVDAGFIVFNPTTHPNFFRFMNERCPDIAIIPTEMSFSVSRDHGTFEWASNGLRGVFCQPMRLLDPRMWRLLYDIIRFNVSSRRLVIDKDSFLGDCSIAEFLAREGYSDTFRDDYLIPMTAAICSIPPDRCLLEFPVHTLIRFMNNHHMLQIMGRPTWLTIKGGSHQYVNSILEKLPNNQLHLSTPIASVGNAPDGRVEIKIADGRLLNFDRVIMACHSDTTLALLKAGYGMTEKEEMILSRFTWSQNEVVLHSDISVFVIAHAEKPGSLVMLELPDIFFGRTSCMQECEQDLIDMYGPPLSLAFIINVIETHVRLYPIDNMNLLQHLSPTEYGPLLVTLNPPVEPANGTVVARFDYAHPVLNAEALASMREMYTIQGRRGIMYAGAWLGYGFHEDGFTSGMRAVTEHIEGIQLPFDITFASADQVRRSAREVVGVFAAAWVFDWLERSGASVLGRILAFVLVLSGRLVGLFVSSE